MRSVSLSLGFLAHTSVQCAISNLLAVAAVKATNFALTLISRTVPKKREGKGVREERERRERMREIVSFLA